MIRRLVGSVNLRSLERPNEGAVIVADVSRRRHILRNAVTSLWC